MEDHERNNAIPRKDWNLLRSSFAFFPLAYTGEPWMFLMVVIAVISVCGLSWFVRRFIKVVTGSEKAVQNGYLRFKLENPFKKELVFLNKGTAVSYRTEKGKKVSFYGRTVQSGEVMIGNAPEEEEWIIKAIMDMDKKQLKAFVHGDEIEMIVVDIEEDMKGKRLGAPGAVD